MTFYQELQLNQGGSKNLIRHSTDPKEKIRHMAVYVFKILLTLAFCMAFVISYSKIFGDENSIVGVVVLLCVMVFRYADFGFHAKHSISAMVMIFLILAFGPRLANSTGAAAGLLINGICIFVLMFLGCHNVVLANHSTLVLGYLLLYGYDVSGTLYVWRLAGIVLGAALTGIVYYRNHRKKQYKREMKSLFEEFRLDSTRTRWQMTVTLGVASALFIGEVLNIPRSMWIGIAAMSVIVPFQIDLKERVKGRIPGNIAGGILFLVICTVLPESAYSYIGIIGGIGVGFSATYRWQAVFNSLGAMAVAVTFLGIPGAVFFRIFNNVFGAVYGQIFRNLCDTVINRIMEAKNRKLCMES